MRILRERNQKIQKIMVQNDKYICFQLIVPFQQYHSEFDTLPAMICEWSESIRWMLLLLPFSNVKMFSFVSIKHYFKSTGIYTYTFKVIVAR